MDPKKRSYRIKTKHCRGCCRGEIKKLKWTVSESEISYSSYYQPNILRFRRHFPVSWPMNDESKAVRLPVSRPSNNNQSRVVRLSTPCPTNGNRSNVVRESRVVRLSVSCPINNNRSNVVRQFRLIGKSRVDRLSVSRPTNDYRFSVVTLRTRRTSGLMPS